jgi:hypothetical protein
MGIEVGNLRDGEEFTGMIVAGVIAMFGKSSEDRGTRTAERSAKLWQGEHLGCPEGFC